MQKQDSESECAVMTLSEAIAHADEKSRELNGGCAANHSLLARWLTEYRDILSKSDKQAHDNSWHERGEFPHAGCECEFAPKSGGAWVKTKVIAITNQNVILLPNGESVEFVFRLSNVIFRPIRTEREKAIDEMLLAIDHIKEGNFETFIGALYDAGYRMVKP